MSSHQPYEAERSLRLFATHGCNNRDGWGVGYFFDSVAEVRKSSQPTIEDRQAQAGFSAEFGQALREANSQVIVGHLRLASRGGIEAVNNHPFKLNFAGYDWLFAHNGTARNPEQLVRPADRILTESTCDSARVFEFLRARIVEYMAAGPLKSLICAVRRAYEELLGMDNGSFNVLLSNGHLSFACLHHRQFYLVQRSKELGNTVLLSTLKLNDHERWQRVGVVRSYAAKMLVFSGHTLIYNGDIENPQP